MAELERYYLPRTDLNAHQQGLDALAADGRLVGNLPSITLDDIVVLMIRYSSNAATDYMHFRLGHARIESQLAKLDVTAHTAPCPFLGQFLVIGNHLRRESNRAALEEMVVDPEQYGVAVIALADLYRRSEAFRADETAARRQGQRPSLADQRFFTGTLATRASAAAYATLMARLAQNGLADADSAFHVRRHLEWPMQFESNQALYYNLGYKGGALPGALAVAYYAYAKPDAAPYVVALFFHPLPDSTYRQWQRNQSHDALARWLIGTPGAVERLRSWINESDP